MRNGGGALKILSRRNRLWASPYQVVFAICLFNAHQYGQARKAGASPKSINEAKRLFLQSQDALGQGKLEEAKAAALRGVKLSPQSVDGYNLLGMIYSQEKDYTQSLAAFRQALKLNPSSSETHHNLGKSYFAQQKLESAAKEFRATLRLDSRHRDANCHMGLVLMALGQPSEAISFFQRVQPPDLDSLMNLTRSYLRAGQTAQGLELARRISARDKTNVRLHFSLGVLLASEKQYGQAQVEYELADDLSPGTFEILNNLGQAYLRNGHYPRAEMTLERALALKPLSTNTMYLLGQAYSVQQKRVSAIELLVRARELAPQDTNIIFLLARLLMSQSFYEDAIQLLQDAVRLDPQRADLRASLGECYLSMVKLDKAIHEFENLIKLDPSARSYGYMADALTERGRNEEALSFLEEAVRKKPDDASTQIKLGQLYLDLKRFDESLNTLRVAQRLAPEEKRVHYLLGRLYSATKRRDLAQKEFAIFKVLEAAETKDKQTK